MRLLRPFSGLTARKKPSGLGSSCEALHSRRDLHGLGSSFLRSRQRRGKVRGVEPDHGAWLRRLRCLDRRAPQDCGDYRHLPFSSAQQEDTRDPLGGRDLRVRLRPPRLVREREGVDGMKDDPDLTGGCGLVLVIIFTLLVIAIVVVIGLMLGMWAGFLRAAGL